MKKRVLKTLAAMAVLAAGAFAAPITITFTNSPASGLPGTTVTLNATMVNTTASTEFLNGDSFTLSSPFALSDLDDALFFSTWPLSLAGNASFGSQGLFTVTIPTNAAAGTYTETYNLLGGTGANDQNLIGTTTFQVTVLAPEPASGLGVALGLGLLGWRLRRRAQRARGRAEARLAV